MNVLNICSGSGHTKKDVFYLPSHRDFVLSQCCQMTQFQSPTLMTETNQLTYTTDMIKGETQTVGRPIICLMTFC